MPAPKKIRLQKYLSDLGVDSRRRCEQYIKDGLVRVNGKVVTQMGTCVDPARDKVEFERRTIRKRREATRTLMLHKPRGYVCTTSSKEGKSVYSLLKDVPQNVVCIGRLDKKSEGLLLFSNDGDLVYRITHPSFGHAKVYHVMVSGDIDETVLKRLNGPMVIDGYRTRPARVHVLRAGQKPGRLYLQFELQEGRNRQIRKMCEALKLTVHRLKRVQVCDIKLGGLRPGDFRDLNPKELRKLKA